MRIEIITMAREVGVDKADFASKARLEKAPPSRVSGKNYASGAIPAGDKGSGQALSAVWLKRVPWDPSRSPDSANGAVTCS